MSKLEKGSFPTGHSAADFECFGPAATKDGDFNGTMIVDMGCFNQDEVDSNKYYHACVCQSKKTKVWYAYFEWGRVGAKNPQFQFVECGSKAQAESEYIEQCRVKNDKRGEWYNHPSLGRILRAKKGKDCYLVRPQATRSTGLPSARTIKTSDGVTKAKPVDTKVPKTKAKKVDIHPQVAALMRDLNVGTVSFTRGAMTDDSLPTSNAINEARDILTEALKRVAAIGDNIREQVKDRELYDLTKLIYGRIPKKKERGAAEETWILSKDNIASWQQDLDAFESALVITDMGDEVDHDPFGGLKVTLDYLDPASNEMGKFIHQWMPKATRNVHYHIGNMRIRNVWSVDRADDAGVLERSIQRVANEVGNISERALHQPPNRPDLTRDLYKQYVRTNTSMLFHGTRSVNVTGILRESLRLPKQLVGVHITGAMFGGGIYWADDWKKSAGYTSLSGSIWSGGAGSVRGRAAFMFIGDVVLGNPFVAPRASGYVGPPKGHHSIFGKAGHSGVQNNEWIVFNKDQNNLRYLVEFET